MKRKPATAALKRPRKAVAKRRQPQSPLEPLVLELFGVVKEALTAFGVSGRQQRQLFDQAQSSRKVNRVSEPLLHEHYTLGELISTWREEAPYIDARGQPRVLPIKGGDVTFESLCRQFLPHKTVEEVVQLACRAASVGTLSDGRIALYGDTFVDLSHSPDTALAQTILHVTRVMDTCLHNVRQTAEEGSTGRMERHVHHRLSAEDFENFQSAIRPQLHDLCERVDRMLQSKGRRNRSGKKVSLGTAGLGIYLYHYGEGEQTARLRGAPRK